MSGEEVGGRGSEGLPMFNSYIFSLKSSAVEILAYFLSNGYVLFYVCLADGRFSSSVHLQCLTQG